MKHLRFKNIKDVYFSNGQEREHESVVTVSEYKPHGREDYLKVGDVVKVFDGSYNVEMKTGIHRFGIDPLFQNFQAVVIKTDSEIFLFDKSVDSSLMKLNVVLLFPEGTRINTTDCCCLIVSREISNVRDIKLSLP